MKELLFLLGATAGEAALTKTLLKVKMNETDFAQLLKAAYEGLQPLMRLVEKTDTKVDDTLVGAVLNSVKGVADVKDIELK